MRGEKIGSNEFSFQGIVDLRHALPSSLPRGIEGTIQSAVAHSRMLEGIMPSVRPHQHSAESFCLDLGRDLVAKVAMSYAEYIVLPRASVLVTGLL